MSEEKTFWTFLFFKSNRVFVDIFWLACRLTLIFFERNCMIMENVLNTQNIVLGRQESFIRRLEVILHSLKAGFRSSWRPRNLAPKSWGSETHLQTTIKNFLDVLEQCSGYLKHCSTSCLYTRKKLGSSNASIPRKLRKSKKCWIFDFSEPDFVVAMRSEKPPWESAK